MFIRISRDAASLTLNFKNKITSQSADNPKQCFFPSLKNNFFLSSLDFSFQIFREYVIEKFYIRCYNLFIISPVPLYKGHDPKCAVINKRQTSNSFGANPSEDVYFN